MGSLMRTAQHRTCATVHCIGGSLGGRWVSAAGARHAVQRAFLLDRAQQLRCAGAAWHRREPPQRRSQGCALRPESCIATLALLHDSGWKRA